MQNAIHKSAAVILQDRKLLLSRNQGKDIFIAPGGKLEPGETSVQALIREMKEEQGITIVATDVELLGTYHAVAAGQEAEQTQLMMDVYFVHKYKGELSPQAEIAENLWWDTSLTEVKQGSIFEHDVIPELVRRKLLD